MVRFEEAVIEVEHAGLQTPDAAALLFRRVATEGAPIEDELAVIAEKHTAPIPLVDTAARLRGDVRLERAVPKGESGGIVE